MNLKWAMGLGGAFLLLTALLPVPASASSSSIWILFDLGDGTYVWANETVPNPQAVNATWLAVQHAAHAKGVAVLSSWFSCCGVAIFDLGNRHSPAGFVGLFRWNATAREWTATSVGISGLVIANGDAIALYNAAYDSTTFDVRKPVPNPDNPLPSIEFRSDLTNSGTSLSTAPNRARVVWDHNTTSREIASTPAVGYGKVFVNTMQGTVALDEGTGRAAWVNSAARGFSSPAVFDGSVIVSTSNGTVVRLNATTGGRQWETRLLSRTMFSGITASPKVAFDWVFIGTFNESGGPGAVASLWASNGTIRWTHATASVDYSSVAYAGGSLYVGVMGIYNTTSQVAFGPPYGVLSLDASTGTERWFFPTSGSVAASPALFGSSLVIAPSKDGNVYALNASTGQEVWHASVAAGVSSPAIFGDTVVVGGGAFGSGGQVVALDARSGTQRWAFTANGPIQGSVAFADGKVIVASNTDHGTIYALNATSGTLLWSFEPSPSEYILGSPVVADGYVFAPSDNGHVYALGQAPATTPSTGSLPTPPILGIALIVSVVVIAVAVWFTLRRRSRGGP